MVNLTPYDQWSGSGAVAKGDAFRFLSQQKDLHQVVSRSCADLLFQRESRVGKLSPQRAGE